MNTTKVMKTNPCSQTKILAVRTTV